MIIFAPFKITRGRKKSPDKAAFLLPAIFGTNKHSSTVRSMG